MMVGSQIKNNIVHISMHLCHLNEFKDFTLSKIAFYDMPFPLYICIFHKYIKKMAILYQSMKHFHTHRKYLCTYEFYPRANVTKYIDTKRSLFYFYE